MVVSYLKKVVDRLLDMVTDGTMVDIDITPTKGFLDKIRSQINVLLEEAHKKDNNYFFNLKTCRPIGDKLSSMNVSNEHDVDDDGNAIDMQNSQPILEPG